MKKINMNNLQTYLSTSALLNEGVLAYRLPLANIGAYTMRQDVERIIAATVPELNGMYLHVNVREKTLYVPNHRYEYAVRIKTSTEKVTSSGRQIKQYREVKFDSQGRLLLAALRETVLEVIKIEKVLAKAAKQRRAERERKYKLKQHTMRFMGVTEDRSRKLVEVGYVRYDGSKPEQTEISLDLVGEPEKLKKAIAALKKLGVVGRKS